MTARDQQALGEQGFTLIEALVALLILAIAATGLVRAAEAHVDSIRNVERRTAAELVAQNRLSEIAIGDPGSGNKRVEMLGQQWTVSTKERATADPDLRAVTVAVASVDTETPLVSLEGFRDVGTTTR